MGGNTRGIGRGAIAIALATGILTGGSLAATEGDGLPEAFAESAAPATEPHVDPESAVFGCNGGKGPLGPNRAGSLGQIGKLASCGPAKAAGRLGAPRSALCFPVAGKAAGQRPVSAAKAAEIAAFQNDTRSETAARAQRNPSEAKSNTAAASRNDSENGTHEPSGAGSTASGASPVEQGASSLPPRSLTIGGATIPYRDVRGGTTPDAGAGLWLGADSTSDGSWGYFVGHNPGSFAPVMGLGNGNPVTLCDSEGNMRTYTVRSVFTVEASATWKAIASRVTGFGESVILQTCTGDGFTNTIVVAA